MNLAVVVLTYNRSDALRLVLRSLAGQCRAGDQVIVADDGSRSGHVRAVCDVQWGWPCEAWHVWHPDTGFTAASARNNGVACTDAPYIVFLDGDCVPDRDFLERHREFARQGCFVNGSRVLLSPTMTQKVLTEDMDLLRIGGAQWMRYRMQGHANKLSHLLRWPAHWRGVQAQFRWKGIRSCNLAAWRSDVLAIDGFDEVFNGWGHEDADFVLRLHHHGLSRINANLATEVFHLWHQENPRQNEEHNRRRVMERAGTDIVRAEQGLSQVRPDRLQRTRLR